ncbi:GIY-YIG nuclease family protein [Nakamurella panacisegetis]|nr:GIY-YIG nuclease family protein [Nakamurella panacisegetis]
MTIEPRSLADAVTTFDHREALVHDPPQMVLDGTVRYTLGGSVSVPADPGVYLIHDLRGVLYVGRTANLYQRYFQHYWDSHNSRVTAALRRPLGRMEFSWMSVDLVDQADLERTLIRSLQPLCNRLLYKH